MSELHPGPSRPMQHHEVSGPHNPSDKPTGTAETLYRALRATALQAAEARNYARSVTHVTVHLPVEIVGLALDRSRTTVWRAARRLKALGLIDSRPHKCTALNGRVVNDGTLWAVRLDPDQGSPAALTYEELKHEWRDLDRDRRRGRTAFRAVQTYRAEKEVKQSKEPPTEGYDLELLLAWSMPPQHPEGPLHNDCYMTERRDLESVLDVPHVAREDRGEAVDGAAEALCTALRDRQGVMFYRWLLWQLLRLQDRTGGDHFYQVYLQAQRAAVDSREGFARRPGALFVSRIKTAPWWSEMRDGPPLKVGPRPRRIGA